MEGQDDLHKRGEGRDTLVTHPFWVLSQRPDPSITANLCSKATLRGFFSQFLTLFLVAKCKQNHLSHFIFCLVGCLSLSMTECFELCFSK